MKKTLFFTSLFEIYLQFFDIFPLGDNANARVVVVVSWTGD